MLTQIIVGCVMVVVTTAIHATFMVVGVKSFNWLVQSQHRLNQWNGALIISAFILVLLAASAIEIGLWASLYQGLGITNSLEEAVYFSAVTYSTLGYGDVTLQVPWRILASFQAVLGLILFGWTAALVIGAVDRIYFRQNSAAN